MLSQHGGAQMVRGGEVRVDHPTSAPVRPAEPSGQPGWLLASLSGLAAALALSGGWPYWVPDGPAAEPESGTQPDTVTVRPLDRAAAPPGSPITLPATGCWHTLPAAPATCPCPVRTRLLERIPSPLMLVGDLGKRRSAQR